MCRGVFHSCTKHLDIKGHILREKVDDGVIELIYKPTDEIVADGLTKVFGRVICAKLIPSLHLKE
ncbi:hypothetical protein KXD40_009430 [Peronospora effusa]|nr:hypothetical protein KXD40_009430 [Peronospora effusa]